EPSSMCRLLKHQPRRTTSARATRARCRPRLETLDDRCLLSVGALDPTFGNGGIVTTSVGSATSWNGAAAVGHLSQCQDSPRARDRSSTFLTNLPSKKISRGWAHLRPERGTGSRLRSKPRTGECLVVHALPPRR